MTDLMILKNMACCLVLEDGRRKTEVESGK